MNRIEIKTKKNFRVCQARSLFASFQNINYVFRVVCFDSNYLFNSCLSIIIYKQ